MSCFNFVGRISAVPQWPALDVPQRVPAGGVNVLTAGDFLKAGTCAVAVGSELVNSTTVEQ